MEILIPGLILVALMAWASTKIKRAAAAAYEAETVTTDEFAIEKPEGIIHPLNDDSKYLFEAYTKDFGTADEHSRERQVAAYVTRADGSGGDEAESSTADGRTVFRKTLGLGDGQALLLEVVALTDHLDENRDRVERLLGSFRAR
ncbi:MAG: hypothetical protein ACK4S4_02050 [Pyrinomonadaceae bacterium]